MIHVIYIPVIFICMANHCEFIQAQVHFVREAECRAVVDVQKKRLQDMAAKAGQTINLIEGTCVTAKDGTL